MAAWLDISCCRSKNTHCGRYPPLVLSFRSRMASLTIRRKTTPVRGWEDSSPFLAATRTALRKSPIGASFKINRLTPCLTSSRMASCSVALRRFRLRARDAYFARCVFTCRCLNATCQRRSWPRSVFPIEYLQIGFGPLCSSESHLTTWTPSTPAPLATYNIRRFLIGGIARRDGKGTGPLEGGWQKPRQNPVASIVVSAHPAGAVGHLSKKMPFDASRGGATSRHCWRTIRPYWGRNELTAARNRRYGGTWRFPGEGGARASQGCCGRDS